MAYTNAIFYLDRANGVDTARTALTSVSFANNGSGGVRATKTGHGLITGAVVDVTISTNYNSAWKITQIDANTFDLDTATYIADRTGTVTPRGGQSWADAWKTFNSGGKSARHQAGDTIRIAKSPAPYSVGTASWNGITASGGPGTQLSITSSTNATPIVITRTAHGYSNGDVVQVLAHTVNTTANGVWKVANVTANTFELEGSSGVGAGGATGTVQLYKTVVAQLSTAQNTTISHQKVNWSVPGTGDVTPTLTAANGKDSYYYITYTFDASVQTNTLQAYFTIPSTDFSAYQGITFWFKPNATLTSSNQLYIALCSDTAGATIVDTFPITAVTSGAGNWSPYTIMRSGGGNLGSAIQSVALYTGSSAYTNSANVIIDRIIACKSSNINLRSLISKNTQEQGGAEPWLGLRTINGSILVFDIGPQAISSGTYKGYVGTTESIATYARETITGDGASTMQLAGTVTSPIYYEGGYDTSSTVQNGETIWDGLGLATGVTTTSFSQINWVGFVRYVTGISVSASDSRVNNLGTINNNTTSGIFLSGSGSIVNFIWSSCNNSGTALNISGSNVNVGDVYTLNGNVTGIATSGFYDIIKSIANANNNSTGVQIQGSANLIKSVTNANYNSLYGVSFSNSAYKSVVAGGSYSGNGLACLHFAAGQAVKDCSLLNSNLIGTETNINVGVSLPGDVWSINNDQTQDNDWMFSWGSSSINKQNSVRQAASGYAWQFTIGSSSRHSAMPLSMQIATFAVNANTLVTFKAYMKKSHATNVACQIRIQGGQITGVANDLIATKANDTNWEELTITFTPTQAGVVTAEALAWYVSGNANCYLDTLSLTQA